MQMMTDDAQITNFTIFFLYTTVPTELSDDAVSSEDVCGMGMTLEMKEGGR